MRIVVKLGGHLISTPNGLRTSFLKDFSSLISELFDGDRWCVVVGGGEEARRYVSAARALGLSESVCDIMAVKITRIHAQILASIMGEKAHPAIPESLEQLIQYSSYGKIVVSGGFQPAQSTTAVAALAAEGINADKLIIATDVDGVYTADPKRDPNARLLNEISISELRKLLGEGSHLAGEYRLIDLLTLKVLERSRIPTIILNGNNLENIRKAILGTKTGTLIKPK